MIYRINSKNKDKISQLAFGCMRFPKKGTKIDLELSNKLVKEAIDKGINYFDAAYMYPGIEEALGTILEKEKLRDKVFIATKLPIFMCKNKDDFDKLFNKELERLKTDRIDYYLLHMLSSTLTFNKLESIGIKEWIDKKKKEGKIINIGFSYHGGKEEFKKLIDSYDWDFCMIQYNYIDENNQAGKEGLEYAYNKGTPVFIMEPLRGGSLINGLPNKAIEVFKKTNPNYSLASWGLKWLYNQKEITTVLSGMNSLDQLNENINIANSSNIDSLTEEEKKAYEKVKEIIKETIKIPCTGCGYCLPCPANVDIPTCFSCYNEIYSEKYFIAIKRYFMTTGILTPKTRNASNCIKCGKCEKHCPQGIEIRKELKRVNKKLESFWYRPARFVIKKVTKV